MQRTISALLAAAALALAASLPAVAQEALTNIRGTIASLTGSSLVVNAREGGVVTIELDADVQVHGVAAASIADIDILNVRQLT